MEGNNQDFKDLETRVIYDSYKSRVEVFFVYGNKFARKIYKIHKIAGIPISFISRCLCSREVKALEKLKGNGGFQQIVSRDSLYSFVSLYAEGTPLKKAKEVPDSYFEKLSGLVDIMHSKGVADLDLRNRSDLLISPNGNPIILDFDAAVTYSYGGYLKIIKNIIFNRVSKLNKRSLYILRSKHSPDRAPLDNNSLQTREPHVERYWPNVKDFLRHIRDNVLQS